MSNTLILRVAARARYKEKKISDEGNTIYLYSERQVANRNKKKAERIEQLKSSIGKLRTQVDKDLSSEDTKTRLTALAVALIDHTYERVGNEGSADAGHYGVTGWLKKHIKMNAKGATVTYVGKSGVKHEKKVTDAKILKALRKVHADVEGQDTGLFDHEDGTVDAKTVNAYLKPFKVTAKDLRGYHANREMQENLRAIRSKGGKLPSEKKAKEKKLKEEFKEALEIVAEAVGHEAATLRSQYLVPKLEDVYMKDGEVLESFTKEAFDTGPKPPLVFANRVIRMLVDHLHGPDMMMTKEDYSQIRVTFRSKGGSWEPVWQGDTEQLDTLKAIVNVWAKMPERQREADQSDV